jgi:hypothetical protein
MSDQEKHARDELYAYQKTLHTAYKELRSEADQVALELGGRYEKMLSLVAGGALAISVTFIEKIAPSPIPGSRWLALSSWIILSASLVATLYAITESQKAQQKKIENMDSEILQKLYPEDDRYKDLDVSSNPYAKKVRTANYVSLRCAVIGLLCLLIFVFINFPAAKKDEQQEPPKSAENTGKDSVNKLLVCADEKPNNIATTATKAEEKTK